MRYTNFAGGVLGKIVGVIMCIVLGVVLTIGGIALGGYILLTKKGMVGQLEDMAKGRSIPIEFDESLREMSLLDWGKDGLLPMLANFTTTPIGDIEKTIGVAFVSQSLSDITGLDPQTIKDSTLGDFGKTFADNLTLQQASENFGIEFPDLPIFQDPEFLSQPLATAFSAIDNFAIQDFIEVNHESSPVLQNLATMKIGEMSDPELGLDKRINDMPLKDVITINEEGANQSNKILIKLKDVKVGELGSSETNDLIMTMTLEEVIEITEGESSPALWELRDTPIGQLGSSDTDDKIKNMKVATFLEVTPSSSPILRYFDDNDITLAGTDESGQPNGINEALRIMRLKDMMTLVDPDEPGGSTKLFWALRDCPLETIPAEGDDPEVPGIQDTIKTLPLNELLDTGDTHIWAYLGQSTTENLGQRIDDMLMRDIIDITEESPAILRKMRVYDPEFDAPGTESMFGAEDIKLSELNIKLEPLIQSMELGELIPVDESSEPILKALEHTTVGGMNDKIALLKINEVFSESVYSTGVLSLVDEETPITGIADALTSIVSNARMQVLINCGVLDEPAIVDKEIDAGFRNKTINGIISDYVTLLNNPFAGTGMLPERIFLDPSENYIDMDFINNRAGFDEGDSLILGANTTIAAENFTKIFNVMTNGFTLTIEPGATIRSMAFDGFKYYDRGGFLLLDTDYGPNDIFTGVPIYDGGGTINGHFENPEGIKDNYKINIGEL